MNQTFSSSATSINARAVPAAFRLINWERGTVNADVGGGRYDTGTVYAAERGVASHVIDPYNRTAAHNARARAEIVRAGGADTATVSNVLNVIDTAEARRDVLITARELLRDGGTVYITVYEGDGSGRGRQTGADSWQENRRTASYLPEVRAVFPDAERRGRLIIGRK